MSDAPYLKPCDFPQNFNFTHRDEHIIKFLHLASELFVRQGRESPATKAQPLLRWMCPSSTMACLCYSWRPDGPDARNGSGFHSHCRAALYGASARAQHACSKCSLRSTKATARNRYQLHPVGCARAEGAPQKE